jgi:hypothetical protein
MLLRWAAVRSALRALGILAAVAALSCDRAVEPYVPGEKPESPDLSRIFPEGAERATKDAGPMGGTPGSMPPAAPGGRGAAPVAGGDAKPVTGTVKLAPGLERKQPVGAILFIVARGSQGGGPPVAVKRIESPQLPLEFSLGPGDRMIQAIPFVGPLQLSARLDADGNAMTRAPGDLQGQSKAPHEPGDQGVEIVIDEVL